MNTFALARRPSPAVAAVPTRVAGLRRPCGCAAKGPGCPKCRERDSATRPPPAQGRNAMPVPDANRGHDFTRLPLHGRHEMLNGADDEGAESVDAPPPSTTGSGGTQPAPTVRPSGTKVDTTTSYTQAALQAGYLSGLGIVARMSVLPDSINWDGKEVVEQVTQTSSTCPEGLTRPGPCNGNSHFPIGAKLRARGVRPEQPATHNRFYDIHTSQSEDLSFLHDATRNPKGIDACETVCHQDYLYDGVVVGSHSIRRQFRKGTAGGHDVTIVDVTKTDLAPAASGGGSGTQPAPGGSGGSGGQGKRGATP